ncbi:ATP-dependent DNA helicase tlh1, partial [Neolecta irregularis DAH-3]
MFAMPYHKAQAVSDMSRFVCRFLPEEVGTLLVAYLSLILPFRNYLHNEITQQDSSSAFIWTTQSGVWETRYMTTVLKKQTEASQLQSLKVSSWRHIASGILKEKFNGINLRLDYEKDNVDNLDQDISSFAFLQASHTAWTSNMHYSNTLEFDGQLTAGVLLEYRKVSKAWHKFLQFGTYIITSSNKRKPDLLADAENPPSKRVLLEPQGVTHQRLNHKTIWSAEEVDIGLCKLYGNDANFKSHGQKQALMEIVSGTSQIIVILPTAGGKSLLFILPSVLHGSGTTILILPLVALRQDMERRLKELGIPYALWSHEQQQTSSLIIVTIEQASTDSFKSYLLKLSSQNQLDRIVMDECHLIFTASDYRP